LLTGSEDNNLEVFISFQKTLAYLRANVDSCVDRLFIFRKLDRDNHIRTVIFDIIDTVNERLIHIKHYRLASDTLKLRYIK